MSTEGKSTISIRKVIGTVGAIVLLILGVVMGVHTFQAWKSTLPLSNWKGGTMRYRDGFQLAVTFACMGAAYFYFANKSRSDADKNQG